MNSLKNLLQHSWIRFNYHFIILFNYCCNLNGIAFYAVRLQRFTVLLAEQNCYGAYHTPCIVCTYCDIMSFSKKTKNTFATALFFRMVFLYCTPCFFVTLFFPVHEVRSFSNFLTLLQLRRFSKNCLIFINCLYTKLQTILCTNG